LQLVKHRLQKEDPITLCNGALCNGTIVFNNSNSKVSTNVTDEIQVPECRLSFGRFLSLCFVTIQQQWLRCRIACLSVRPQRRHQLVSPLVSRWSVGGQSVVAPSYNTS